MTDTIDSWGAQLSFLLRYPDPKDWRWSAFNPSVCADEEGLAVVIRSSNYRLNPYTYMADLNMGYVINSRLWFSRLNDDLTLANLREVAFDHGEFPVARGVEDARLYRRDGSWRFTAVMLEKPHTMRARLCTYSLDEQTSLATLIEKHAGPDPERPEKNWMVSDVPTEKFDFIYSMSKTIQTGELRSVSETNASLPALRGGTNLLLQPDGTYISIVHSVEIESKSGFNPRTFTNTLLVRKYLHYFARWSADGALIQVTDPFKFYGDAVEYAAGLAQKPGTEDYVISFGRRDIEAHLAVLPISAVTERLRNID